MYEQYECNYECKNNSLTPEEGFNGQQDRLTALYVLFTDIYKILTLIVAII